MSDEEIIDGEEDETDAPAVLVMPGEVGAIIPELDGKGGTQYRLGEEVYDTEAEAREAFDAAVQGQPGLAPAQEAEAEAREERDEE